MQRTRGVLREPSGTGRGYAGAMAAVVRTSVVIGLEVHVQLATRTKMFSRAPSPAGFGATDRPGPNTLVDAVVLGLPGTLPTPNADAPHAQR